MIWLPGPLHLGLGSLQIILLVLTAPVGTLNTVPGFRSKLLRLTAKAPTRLDITTAPAAVVHGLVTFDGEPLADQFIGFRDAHGRFAGGVVTDENGRYRIESFKPGRYTGSTLGVKASARLEAGTPYWVETRATHARVRPGKVTDVGWIDVRVRG